MLHLETAENQGKMIFCYRQLSSLIDLKSWDIDWSFTMGQVWTWIVGSTFNVYLLFTRLIFRGDTLNTLKRHVRVRVSKVKSTMWNMLRVKSESVGAWRLMKSSTSPNTHQHTSTHVHTCPATRTQLGGYSATCSHDSTWNRKVAHI